MKLQLEISFKHEFFVHKKFVLVLHKPGIILKHFDLLWESFFKVGISENGFPPAAKHTPFRTLIIITMHS